MQCQICGYLLDHLDNECPRCKVLRERGVDPATARTDPTGAHLTANAPPPTRSLTHPGSSAIATSPEINTARGSRDAAAHDVDRLGLSIQSVCLVLGGLVLLWGIVGLVLAIARDSLTTPGVVAVIIGISVIGTGRIWRIVLHWGAEVLRTLGRMEDQ